MKPQDRWRKEFRPHSGAVLSVQLFVALAGAFAMTTVGVAQHALDDELIGLVRSLPARAFSSLDVMRLITYFYFLIFGLLWGINGYKEIYYLQDWLKPPKALAISRYAVYLLTICIGIALGLLFSLSPHFQALITIFALYSLADIWLWRVRQNEVARWLEENEVALLRDARSVVATRPDDCEQTARTILTFAKAGLVLKAFYVDRPHKTRVLVQCLAATALGVIWVVGVPFWVPLPRPWVEVTGYAVFLIIAAGSEYVIHRWRRTMDVGLAELDHELGL